MNKYNILWIFLLLILFSFPLTAQSGLSIIDIQVSGAIQNYVVEDLDQDGRSDLIISYTTNDRKKSNNRFLAVFFQTADGFPNNPNQTLPIDDDAIVYDVANVVGDNQKEIVYINSRGVFYIPLVKNVYRRENAKLLIETFTMFSGADADNFEYYNFARIVTNSTYDDLLIPLGGTTLIASRSESKNRYIAISELYSGVSLKIKRDANLGMVSANQQSYAIEILNLNNDGLLDIAFIYENHIDFFLQSTNQDFNQTADKEINFRTGGLKTKTQIKLLKDLNNDGLADVFIERVDFSDRMDLKKEFEIYNGSRDSKSVLNFSVKPDFSVSQKGIWVNAIVEDIDGDSKYDLAILNYGIGITNIFNTFLSNSIKVNFNLYIQKGNTFSPNPTYQKDIEQEIDIRRDYFRNLFYNISCDLNGDGFNELISFRDNKTLVVYLGNRRTYLSSAKSFSETIIIPENGNNISAQNIFSKQKQDMVIRYDQEDAPSLRNTLKIISK